MVEEVGIYAGVEVYFTAILKDTLAHGTYNSRQTVAADMGMGFVEYAIVGTKITEQLHHPLHITAFLATREQLTI